MTRIDPFAIYGWLGMHFLNASERPGFDEKDTAGQWQALRTEVLAANPPNDAGRREAIDSIEEPKRAEILAWLTGRR
jgi:hypothetical protein